VFAAPADEVLALPWGSAIRTPSLPDWNDLNALRVERAAPELTPQGLRDFARGLGVTRAEIWDEPTAERLLPWFEAEGWTIERHLMMRHAGPRPAVPETVERIDPIEFLPLRRAWLDSIPDLAGEKLQQQGEIALRRTTAAVGVEGFGVRRDGAPVAMASLIDGAMIEDVFTLAAHRGQALGAAVVAGALAAAGDLAYLATDADGLARPLYERLGFEPEGVVTLFVAAT
jgi:GNAT superfamily N-acetyltransferase